MILTALQPSIQLAFGLPGHGEWIILLVLGLLIFGRRLPEVGRWIGQSIVEFKKGIKGVEDDIEEQSSPKAQGRIADTAPREKLGDSSSEEAEADEESAVASAKSTTSND